MNKNITLLITFYIFNENEYKYWYKTYKELKKKNIEFHFLIDNPKIKDNFYKIESKDLFINDKNLGKFLTIYNHIKKGNVKTKYFKTVDPDDYISIKNLLKMSLPEKPEIIRMNSIRIKSKKFLFFNNQKIIDLAFLSLPKKRYSSLGTSWTILPTQGIFNDNFFSGKRIDVNEDQILGIICYANNFRIMNHDYSWYLYIHEYGISKVENFPNYLKKLKITLEEQENIVKKSKRKAPIFWPGNFKYYKSLKFRYYQFNKNRNEELEKIWNELYSKYSIDYSNPKFNNEICNISLVTDNNQIEYALSNIFNMYINSENELKFWLIVDEYDDFKKNLVLKLKLKNPNLNLEVISFSNKDLPKLKSNLKHVTWTTNIRLFLADLLPKYVNKTLYLDNDLLIDGDISEVFRFVGNERGHYGQRWNSNSKITKYLFNKTNINLSKYYNAGVLFLDLELMREEESTKKFIEIYNKFSKYISFADQDIINLSLEINDFLSNFNIAREKWPKQYFEFAKNYNLKIYHFLSIAKPWNSIEENKKLMYKNKKGNLTKKEFENNFLNYKKWSNQFSLYKENIK